MTNRNSSNPRKPTNLGNLFDAETTSIINLFTTFLLLAIVWLVLGPILDGTVAIVRNDRIDYSNYYNEVSDTSRYDEGHDASYGTNFEDATSEQLYAQTADDYYAGGWDIAARALKPDVLLKRAQNALNRYRQLGLHELDFSFLLSHDVSQQIKL